MSNSSIFLVIFCLLICPSFIFCGHVFDYYTFFKKCGFNPSAVLDVGANAGHWTRGTSGIYPSAKFFMVEGNSDSPKYLQSIGHPFEVTLIGNYTGTTTYYKQRGANLGTGNSRYKENSVHFSDAIVVQAPITTIDELVSRRNLGPFQLLKLDIQGGEVDAIRGAYKVLESVEVIQTECSFVAYNKDAPSFYELHSLLHSLGFEFYGIIEVLSTHIMPIQFDGVFVRRTSKLWGPECTTLSPQPDHPDPHSRSPPVLPRGPHGAGMHPRHPRHPGGPPGY